MNPPPKTKFSQGEAAIACGYVKSKISQDMKDGTLSFTRLERNGRVEIDASELIRVYGDRFKPERVTGGSQNLHQNGAENTGEPDRTPVEPTALAVEVKFLHEKLALLEHATAQERTQLLQRIEDMRRSVEDAREQRDRTHALLQAQTETVKQLADQRAKETTIPMPPVAPPDAKKRGGLFGLLSRRSV